MFKSVSTLAFLASTVAFPAAAETFQAPEPAVQEYLDLSQEELSLSEAETAFYAQQVLYCVEYQGKNISNDRRELTLGSMNARVSPQGYSILKSNDQFPNYTFGVVFEKDTANAKADSSLTVSTRINPQGVEQLISRVTMPNTQISISLDEQQALMQTMLNTFTKQFAQRCIGQTS